MALDVFTWIPSYPVADDHEPRLLSSNLGDGYTVDTGDGTNIDLPSWGLQFNFRSQTEADAIVAFIKAHYGIPFLWTPPNRAQVQVKCKQYRNTYNEGNNYTLSATFKEDVCLS